jgi:hypothetical protein
MELYLRTRYQRGLNKIRFHVEWLHAKGYSTTTVARASQAQQRHQECHQPSQNIFEGMNIRYSDPSGHDVKEVVRRSAVKDR